MMGLHVKKDLHAVAQSSAFHTELIMIMRHQSHEVVDLPMTMGRHARRGSVTQGMMAAIMSISMMRDFSVQFDTNLRETSVTPVDIEPNPSGLDFPHMVTGSYLSFNHGGSSNASYNNMRESANLSINNVPVSCAALHFIEDRGQYDSEFSGNSGNSGSRNSAMELSSSERDMMGSSDMIEFSDGPLFTPTPTHILSAESYDRNRRNQEGQSSEMNNSATSGDTNLNVDCCPRKEDYFLSFDASNTKVSESETDISLSATSHDSGQGHWGQSETSHFC